MSTRASKRNAPAEPAEPAATSKKVKAEEAEEKEEQEPEEQEGEAAESVEQAAAAAAVEATDSAPPTPSTTSTPNSSNNNKKGRSLTGMIPELKDAQPSDPNNFNLFLFALLLHKAEYNNFHVSRDENMGLYAWTQNLKREYKNYLSGEEGATSLTPAQIKVLEHLHVPLTSRGDDHWNRFYQLLQAYADRHGHVLVPRLCEIPGLGDWVTDQRRQYKAWKQGQATQLTKERREKLEALGFAWQVRNRPEWEARFQELVEYKKKYGDVKVPQHYKENKALGKWVAKQREQHKLLKKGQHSFLTPYRLEKLNSIGFVWSVRSSLETALEDDVKLPESTPGVLPAAAAPAAAAAAAAIAAATNEDSKTAENEAVAAAAANKDDEAVTNSVDV